jgi:hypothetical protein
MSRTYRQGSKAVAAPLIVALAAVAVGASACASAGKRYSDERTESGTISEIALRGGSGSVTVEPGSGPGTTIKRTFRYSGSRPAHDDRLDGSVLRLDTSCGLRCGVTYVVSVPKGVKVSGGTGSGGVTVETATTVALKVRSGSIKVQGATGDITVETSSGGIEVEGAHGAVVARASSGSVRINGVTGNVVAETSSGGVTVREASGDGMTLRTSSGSITVGVTKAQNVTATAGSGGVDVTVPAGASFDVQARTDHGGTDIGIPDTAGAPSVLNLRTSNGSVTVKTR